LLQCLAEKNIAKGVGVEYDAALVDRAVRLCRCGAGGENSERLQILHQNVLDADFSTASVLFIYLVPEGIRERRPRLLEMLLRGCRIVTYIFSIPDLVPSRVETFKGSTKLYLYSSAEVHSLGSIVERTSCLSGER